NFIKGDDFKLIKIDSLIITLVLTEIYLAINFLPLGVYFNALIISILYSIISDTNTLIHTNDANKTYS
ncbi:hypothetical protein L6278_01305, partial [Candidatus Parcubacteria bacterium]|nr:hypothetical protein [Candidatus Parcubacteria bacterium]